MQRRSFLGSASGTALSATLAAVLPARVHAESSADPSGSRAGLDRLMDRVLWGDIRVDPVEASYLGIDTGTNAWARSRLGDAGLAGRAAYFAHAETMLAQLRAIDLTTLDDAGQTHAGILSGALSNRVIARPWNLPNPGRPYVLTQQDGLYSFIPDFLDTAHPVENRDDAEAYLSRLSDFAFQLDNESALQRHEMARGFAAPGWSLDAVHRTLGEMIAAPAETTTLVTSLASRAGEAGIAGQWQERAVKIVEDAVYPALARQRDLVAQIRPRTRRGDGVWRVPGGDDLYGAAVAYYTTTNLSVEEIHRIGLAQVAEISAELDRVLAEAGLTGGSVGDRLQALNQRPDQLFGDSDAGRAELISFLEGRVAQSWEQVRPAFRQLPDQPLEIRRVPEAIEVGASTAYYQSPAPDGSRPGIFYINLHEMKDWPRYSLPAIIYHEGMPGHHLQTGLNVGNANLHPLLRNMYFGAYSEGWALYAEKLADELGMYQGLERAGALQSWLYRAVRLVVDTGLHQYRWSREKAIDYFGSTVGYPANQTRNEIERYIASPGQACSYKIGQNVWMDGRDRAKAALGDRFDLADFHTVLLDGEMPLGLLDRRIDAYIARKLAA